MNLIEGAIKTETPILAINSPADVTILENYLKQLKSENINKV
jgi:hypothetical protein